MSFMHNYIIIGSMQKEEPRKKSLDNYQEYVDKLIKAYHESVTVLEDQIGLDSMAYADKQSP